MHFGVTTYGLLYPHGVASESRVGKKQCLSALAHLNSKPYLLFKYVLTS